MCVAYVDRPIAEFFDAHFRHTEWWRYLDNFLAPLVWVVVAALFFLLGAGGWVISGRKLAAWTTTPLLCSWSAIWGLAAQTIFKEIFGRAWPDPTYVQNHLYGFHFLHGGPHWSSFPSGTAVITTAIVSVVWIRRPRIRTRHLRTSAVLLAVALLSSVIVTNGHWVSDVIAGSFLGVSIGWMTVKLRH